MAANLHRRHPADAIAIMLVQPLDGDLEDLPSALRAVAIERLGVSAEGQAAVLLDLLDEPSGGAVSRNVPVGVALDVRLGLLAEGMVVHVLDQRAERNCHGAVGTPVDNLGPVARFVENHHIL